MPTYLETFRATVAPADCDHLGHMNVQHYFATVSDGMFASDSALARKKSSGARFRLPLCAQRLTSPRVGDVMALESTVLTLGEKFATFSTH